MSGTQQGGGGGRRRGGRGRGRGRGKSQGKRKREHPPATTTTTTSTSQSLSRAPKRGRGLGDDIQGEYVTPTELRQAWQKEIAKQRSWAKQRKQSAKRRLKRLFDVQSFVRQAHKADAGSVVIGIYSDLGSTKMPLRKGFMVRLTRGVRSLVASKMRGLEDSLGIPAPALPTRVEGPLLELTRDAPNMRDLEGQLERMDAYTTQTLLPDYCLKQLARARSALDSGMPVIAVDVEAYERDHSRILELGICEARCDREISQHIITRDHMHLSNGQFVPDARDDFAGESQSMSLTNAVKHLAGMLSDLVVFHDHTAERKYFDTMGVPCPNVVLDTNFLAGALSLLLVNSGRMTAPLTSTTLEACCDYYSVPVMRGVSFHNAGNDAYYTILVLRRLIEWAEHASLI